MNHRGAIANAPRLAGGAAMVAVLALAPPAWPAPVEGVWPGTLEQHDDAPTKIKCSVARSEDGTLDAVLLIHDSRLPLNDFRVSTSHVRFSFRPGETDVECRLDADPSKKGSFSGTCPPDVAADDRDAFRLRMSRPKPAPEEPLATEPAGGAAKSEQAASKAESGRSTGKGLQKKQGSEEVGAEDD
jgi:hypothetical protein